SKDQAATIYDGLAWSYTQSRVFDPPSIFDAHAAQGFVLACPIAENKKKQLHREHSMQLLSIRDSLNP
ncbi:MAG: hypothetical protein IJP59_04150, partial [Muribaculaceae bacterium]|nr:hypothetical protein [Muribaculaceae bacterium]